MFARMTIMHIRLDRIDEAIRIYKKSVIPAARSQKGYKGAYLLADRKEGKGVSITFWNNERQEKIIRAKEEFIFPFSQRPALRSS